jgi:hypothetical protein
MLHSLTRPQPRRPSFSTAWTSRTSSPRSRSLWARASRASTTKPTRPLARASAPSVRVALLLDCAHALTCPVLLCSSPCSVFIVSRVHHFLAVLPHAESSNSKKLQADDTSLGTPLPYTLPTRSLHAPCTVPAISSVHFLLAAYEFSKKVRSLRKRAHSFCFARRNRVHSRTPRRSHRSFRVTLRRILRTRVFMR